MMPSNSPPSATRAATRPAPQKVPRKAPTEKPASKPKRVSLVAALRHAYDEIQNCEYNLSARSKLIFNLVVRHCNPLIAVFMADIDGRPATLMHHAEAITEVEAIELRQDLFDQIITQVRQESTSKAFIKRHDGKQFAIVAVPCLQGNDDTPFAGLALAIPETRNDIIRETLDFVELLCRHALQPAAQVSTALAKNPNELDFQRISKAIGYGNEIALAFQLANSISAKFSCEQVSIGVVKGRGVRLTAISGAATIKRNSPGAIAIEQAMEECCDQRDDVAYPALKFRAAPAAAGMHRALSKSSGHAALCSMPIMDGETCVAVVTLRRPMGDAYSEEELGRLREKLAPCGPAFLLLSKSMRSLRQHARENLKETVIRWGTNRSRLTALLVVGLAVAWLMFGKIVYRPSCSSELAAGNLQHIAAPLDGIIQKSHVVAGSVVSKGDMLVEFDASSMELEKKLLRAEAGEAIVDLKAAIAQNDPKTAALHRAKIQTVQAKIAGIDQRLSRAIIAAPADGHVVRCDLASKIGQEFKFGMPLMELAIGNTWSIKVDIPDTIAPYVAPGQIGEFAPFGRPGESYRFEIESISGSADAKNGKNVFVADAKLMFDSGATPTWMKVGMSGVARIETELHPVYWVYFHDALDWFHKKIWY